MISNGLTLGFLFGEFSDTSLTEPPRIDPVPTSCWGAPRCHLRSTGCLKRTMPKNSKMVLGHQKVTTCHNGSWSIRNPSFEIRCNKTIQKDPKVSKRPTKMEPSESPCQRVGFSANFCCWPGAVTRMVRATPKHLGRCCTVWRYAASRATSQGMDGWTKNHGEPFFLKTWRSYICDYLINWCHIRTSWAQNPCSCEFKWIHLL